MKYYGTFWGRTFRCHIPKSYLRYYRWSTFLYYTSFLASFLATPTLWKNLRHVYVPVIGINLRNWIPITGYTCVYLILGNKKTCRIHTNWGIPLLILEELNSLDEGGISIPGLEGNQEWTSFTNYALTWLWLFLTSAAASSSSRLDAAPPSPDPIPTTTTLCLPLRIKDSWKLEH